MLRVGLTGDLGSGKSTVARMLGEHGAVVFSSDDMGRAMMQPGEPVYAAIVRRFGERVAQKDGTLDRRELARLAFGERGNAGRVEELNAIVHPAVLAEQQSLLAELERTQPDAIAVVESALIFSTKHGVAGQPWRERFDCVVLVTAPEQAKVARYLKRVTTGRHLPTKECEEIEHDARRRLALQKLPVGIEQECLVIRNEGGLSELHEQVDALWRTLRRKAERTRKLSADL